MVKRSSELEKEVIYGLKGGKGFVTVVNFFEHKDFLGKGRLYGKSIIEPGNSIGYHVHEGDQEAYYILNGMAKYNDNGKEMTLYPGDIAICEDGKYHSIEALGEENLEYIMLILFN